MIVTEEEYDRWPSEAWEELAHEGRTRHTCATCVHDGQCDGLPNCSGSCWESAYTECDQCGRETLREDAITDDDGHSFCSYDCAENWAADNEEEEEEELEAEDGE